MGATSFKRSQITAFEKYRSLLVGNPAFEPAPQELEYLVIAGGGGGGGNAGANSVGGGGGAGGYRSSVIGESSGGGSSAESVFSFDLSTNYTVTVGAGGGGGAAEGNSEASRGDSGNNSVFATITSSGGGGGGAGGETMPFADGKSGGSGGGANNGADSAGSGTANQGSDGFKTPPDLQPSSLRNSGGGGGGAGTVSTNQDGGIGIESSVTDSSVTRASGGDGGLWDTAFAVVSGSVNSGNGGGAAEGNGSSNTGGNGGSGIVILRYPSAFTITIGAGLTGTENTDGDFKYAEITAGTGNISFSAA